ncbi:MAG: STAS domain-containing protein [Prochloraceae cyanobacterium]
MVTHEIKGEDYIVRYDDDSVMVKFQGELALGGPKEYAPINNLLKEITDDNPGEMTIDLKELTFLNSSGISMLSKFVLGIRKKKEIQLVVVGSNDIPWQGKSLKNLQKFLPSLKLEVE